MKAASALLLLCTLAIVVGKKKEEPLNRETTPFWLQDKTDGKSLMLMITTDLSFRVAERVRDHTNLQTLITCTMIRSAIASSKAIVALTGEDTASPVNMHCVHHVALRALR